MILGRSHERPEPARPAWKVELRVNPRLPAKEGTLERMYLELEEGGVQVVVEPVDHQESVLADRHDLERERELVRSGEEPEQTKGRRGTHLCLVECNTKDTFCQKWKQVSICRLQSGKLGNDGARVWPTDSSRTNARVSRSQICKRGI